MIRKVLLFIGVLFMKVITYAQNPIIQTLYSADPAPLVYKDTLFLYVGHDEDKSTWFTMRDWHVYSTTDMVNWRHRGVGLSLKNFSWAEKDAWAGQCIERNGKFYWYVPVNEKGKGMSIGVAVSDHPTGPFTDAIGKPLLHSGNGDIDPTVFIDNDGQAYLYWGNPYLKYVKLNEDMISYSGEVVTVPLNKEGFNVRYKDADKRPSAYEEGPWLYKRNDLYYMLYAAGGVPEHLAYSTANTPVGPWTYRDTLMSIIKKGGAFTNHPGLVDYRGKSYLFYHNGALPGGGGFTRSVCVDEVNFNADGTIQRVQPTTGIQKGITSLDPYRPVEAETIAWESGVETKTASTNADRIYVTDISGGDFIKVSHVDFKKGAQSFTAHLSAKAGGSIEIYLDSLHGQLLGKLEVNNVAGSPKWVSLSAKVKPVKGVHDLFFVFSGNGNELFDIDWWRFNK